MLGHQYEIYEPNAIPFYSDGLVREIKIDKSLLTHEKNKHAIQVLTGRASQNCNPNEHFCALDTAIRDRHARCIEYLSNKQPMRQINKVCVFKCHKVTSTPGRNDQEIILHIIHAVDYQDITITNPQLQLHIEFANGTSLQLSQWERITLNYRTMRHYVDTQGQRTSNL